MPRLSDFGEVSRCRQRKFTVNEMTDIDKQQSSDTDIIESDKHVN